MDDQQAPFGLLGRSLGHSWSPTIHQQLGSSPYALFEREPDEVASFVREGAWRGLNVTIPYKRVVVQLADELSPRVERLGAANTLTRRADGSIYADNTDVLGFGWMLERFCQRTHGQTTAATFGGRKVLVLGSGGASSAVRAALEDDVSARVITISRTGKETYEGLSDRHGDAALVVNATPVGMYPNCPASPLDDRALASLTDLQAVIDVIYNPERTGICLSAERLGIPNESGLAMLVGQAAASSGAWLGRTHDEMLVDKIVRELRRKTRNVILIGMPGAGKTSTGRRLARLLGRPFVDLDDAFEMKHNVSVTEFLHEWGEARFRMLESELARTYGSQCGLVIACGGGIVTRGENYAPLHQNGIIVFLDRTLEELSTVGRPLSQARGIEALARERMGLYEGWADLRLSCTGSAAGDADAIAGLL